MIQGLFMQGQSTNLSEAVLWAEVECGVYKRIHFIPKGQSIPEGFEKVQTRVDSLVLAANPAESEQQPIGKLTPIMLGVQLKN